MTIQAAMVTAGFTAACYHALSDEEASGLAYFQEWDVTTHCGQECVRIIAAAQPLLKIADPAAHPEIWRGVFAAMSVICIG